MKIKLHLFISLLFISSLVISQNEFITTWETTTPNETITIPTLGTGYNYDVDWENDSTFDDIGVVGNITHTYATPGIYTVAIRGDFPQIYFNNSGDKNKILSIEQWGNIIWNSFSQAFSGCSNMVINAIDAPDLSVVTQMDWTFRYCTSFSQPINHWDMSNVTNITGMFAESSFNQPLNGWDVSNVLFMGTLFYRTPFNQPLNNWDVSNVQNMSFMFSEASSFNRRLNGWDVGNVQSAVYMFSLATSFNQPLNNWDVSSVLDMSNMFNGTTSFNQTLGNWDVSNVTNMSNMFFNVTLSTVNYDDLLIGWESLSSLQNGVVFSGGNSKYCNASNQRDNIISNYSWTITDGGQDLCNLSVDDLIEKSFVIYPNPAQNYFTIQSTKAIDEISIYDLQGHAVKNFKYQNQYGLSDLSSGIYFINIKTDKGEVTKKLIKQ